MRLVEEVVVLSMTEKGFPLYQLNTNNIMQYEEENDFTAALLDAIDNNAMPRRMTVEQAKVICEHYYPNEDWSVVSDEDIIMDARAVINDEFDCGDDESADEFIGDMMMLIGDEEERLQDELNMKSI